MAVFRQPPAGLVRRPPEAVREVPLVVRLTGTNADEGRKILAEAGFVPVETMDEGAKRAVELANATNGKQ